MQLIKLSLLLPASSPPNAELAAAASAIGTTLKAQPAATSSSAAPVAPSDPFPRTSPPGADLEAVRAGIRNIVETTAVDLSVAHSIAAGNAVVLPIQGTAFMIDKGANVGTATLHIQDQTSSPVNSINVFPGDAYELPFTFVVVENTAQAAGTVLRIHYGTGISFKPSLAGTLTISGNVAITQTLAGVPQGVDQDVSNGKAYSFTQSTGVTAGHDAVNMIKNPVGSGKRIYIDGIYVNGFAALLTQWNVFLGATADGATAQGAVGINKKTAAADGVATFFRDFAGTALAGNIMDTLQQSNVGQGDQRRMRTPIILDPGQRCHTQVPGAIAGGINTTIWEYREY